MEKCFYEKRTDISCADNDNFSTELTIEKSKPNVQITHLLGGGYVDDADIALDCQSALLNDMEGFQAITSSHGNCDLSLWKASKLFGSALSENSVATTFKRGARW